MKMQVPIREGLFEERGKGPTLLGTKCKSCGETFFPPKNFCPDCLSEKLEQIALGNRGVLYSYSTVYIPADNYRAPYVVGWVELPDGLRVFAQIRDWENQELKMGMGMVLGIEKLWEEQDKEIIGYVFRPEEN